MEPGQNEQWVGEKDDKRAHIFYDHDDAGGYYMVGLEGDSPGFEAQGVFKTYEEAAKELTERGMKRRE